MFMRRSQGQEVDQLHDGVRRSEMKQDGGRHVQETYGDSHEATAGLAGNDWCTVMGRSNR
jgi:hypothetical protein